MECSVIVLDAPKRVFSCTQCPKEFVRADLLHRHQKRHEKGMHYRSTGGVVRPTVQDNVIQDDNKDELMAMDSEIDLRTDPANFQQSSPPLADDQCLGNISGSMMSGDYFRIGRANPLFFDASTDFQDVPNDLDWFFQDVLQKTPSAASEYDAVPQPVLFPYLQQESVGLSLYGEGPWTTVSSILRSSLDGMPPDVLNSRFFDPDNLADFFDLYFHNYHPHFPFLHRPTLIPVETPPLLLTAIVALGSTLSHDPDHFAIATKIHDDLRWRVCRVS